MITLFFHFFPYINYLITILTPFKIHQKQMTSLGLIKNFTILPPIEPFSPKDFYMMEYFNQRVKGRQKIINSDKEYLYKNTKIMDMVNIVNKQWAALSKEEKEKYVTLSNLDKKRYEEEFSLYKESKKITNTIRTKNMLLMKKKEDISNSIEDIKAEDNNKRRRRQTGQTGRRRKEKRKKNKRNKKRRVRKRRKRGKGEPKRPKSGFIFFSNDRRGEIKNGVKHKDLSFVEVSKLIGNEWNNMTMEQKMPYIKLSDSDKERYQREIKIYKEKKINKSLHLGGKKTSSHRVYKRHKGRKRHKNKNVTNDNNVPKKDGSGSGGSDSDSGDSSGSGGSGGSGYSSDSGDNSDSSDSGDSSEGTDNSSYSSYSGSCDSDEDENGKNKSHEGNKRDNGVVYI